MKKAIVFMIVFLLAAAPFTGCKSGKFQPDGISAKILEVEDGIGLVQVVSGDSHYRTGDKLYVALPGGAPTAPGVHIQIQYDYTSGVCTRYSKPLIQPQSVLSSTQ